MGLHNAKKSFSFLVVFYKEMWNIPDIEELRFPNQVAGGDEMSRGYRPVTER